MMRLQQVSAAYLNDARDRLAKAEEQLNKLSGQISSTLVVARA